MMRNTPRVLLRLSLATVFSLSASALSAVQTQNEANELTQTKSAQSEKSIPNRVADFEQSLTNLKNMAKDGGLPVLFEYERVRIANVLDRALPHLHTLAQAAEHDAAAKSNLVAILNMYGNIDKRVASMTQSVARSVREQASAASKKLSDGSVRSQNESTMAAAALHACIIRSVHPEAFGSRKVNITEMWKTSKVWQKVVAGLVATGVVVAVGGSIYWLVNKDKKAGDDKKADDDKKDDNTSVVATPQPEVNPVVDPVVDPKVEKLRAYALQHGGAMKLFKDGAKRAKAMKEYKEALRKAYGDSGATSKEELISMKYATKVAATDDVSNWLELDQAIHAQRVAEKKAFAFAERTAEVVEKLNGAKGLKETFGYDVEFKVRSEDAATELNTAWNEALAAQLANMDTHKDGIARRELEAATAIADRAEAKRLSTKRELLLASPITVERDKKGNVKTPGFVSYKHKVYTLLVELEKSKEGDERIKVLSKAKTRAEDREKVLADNSAKGKAKEDAQKELAQLVTAMNAVGFDYDLDTHEFTAKPVPVSAKDDAPVADSVFAVA